MQSHDLGQIHESIAGERRYQDQKWGTIGDHPHEVGGWFTLMRKLLNDAEAAWAGSNNDHDALCELRKVLAVGIACAEQHGLPVRDASCFATAITEPIKRSGSNSSSTSIDTLEAAYRRETKEGVSELWDMGWKTCAKYANPLLSAVIREARLRIGDKGPRGIYAGICRGADGAPDYALEVLAEAPKEMNWQDAKAWAESIGGTLPTRREQALCFANVPELFKKAWYWSCEQYAGAAAYAWSQGFDYGYQDYGRKYRELRARAVRRFDY
jgi:hypothetical protein